MWRNDITCLPNCRSMSASVMLDTIRPLCISWSSSISSIARRNDNGIFFINKIRTIRHQYCAHSHYRQVFPSLPQHSSLINTTHTRFQTNAMHYTHAPNTTHSCVCVCLCVEFGVFVARDTTVSCYPFCQYLLSEFTPINANKSVPYLYTIYYTIQCLINDRITHVVCSTSAWFTWKPDMNKKNTVEHLYTILVINAGVLGSRSARHPHMSVLWGHIYVYSAMQTKLVVPPAPRNSPQNVPECKY